MKISVRQSSGWGGLRMGCSVDTKTLPREQARELEETVDGGDLFREPAARPRGADVTRYDIEVETSAGLKTGHFDEIGKPEAAVTLLRIMRPMFKPTPRAKRA